MTVRIFPSMPEVAMQLRTTVFVEEQGFTDEFDAVDAIAIHLVAFGEDHEPLGTCRVFTQDDGQTYLLGRLCVLKEYRGTGVGRLLMTEAEQAVQARGGTQLQLHSQCHACGFYESLGYVACSEVEEEQGCPHVWMKKEWEI